MMMNVSNQVATGRRSPSRLHQQQQGSRGSRQHAWLQSSVARRLLAESRFVTRPSTEPTSNERDWLESSHSGGPGITAEGRYLPSSKAKYEAATAQLQRRRSMGAQKFYSNYYHDESSAFAYQQVPITAWNAPGGTSEFQGGAGGQGRGGRGYTLPDNVTLVTLEEVESGDILLRLAHLYEEGEHTELSKPAYIDLRHLFNGCQIINACEMDLSGSQFRGNLPDLVVELRAMQVRTFLMTIN